MALKLKYKDEHGIVHINMSPNSSPRDQDIKDPQFDTINNRFSQYDLFGGKYDGGESPQSLFRSRYNSIEEELANTPYAFATERSIRSSNKLDITIDRDAISPSKDIEDDRFFRRLSIDYEDLSLNTPAFTVTQLIHAQDRYYDLSNRSKESQDRPKSGLERKVQVQDEAFKVLNSEVKPEPVPAVSVVPSLQSALKSKKEKSFAILTETPTVSRPTSPRSLPLDIRQGKVSPFKGRGFREETSRHNTPRTSAANSQHNSPLRRRTSSLSRIDKMATATMPPPIILRPSSPRNFLQENIEEVKELSELNREKNQAESDRKKIEEEEAILKEMGFSEVEARKEAIRSVHASRNNSRSSSPSKVKGSRSSSPSNDKKIINANDGLPKPTTHRSRVRSVSKSQPQSKDGSPKHSKIPKRQNSVSPVRSKKEISNLRRPNQNYAQLPLNKKFMSSSTSSIHETIRVGSQTHDKRAMSKSTQHLSIGPSHIKGKPPISPGRGGPPPSNKTINAKRLSPIVGTPNKSPVEDGKPGSAKTGTTGTKPSTLTRKPVKTTGNTPAVSRTNSRQPSRPSSREPSPDKRKINSKTASKPPPKPISRTSSTKSLQKPGSGKTDVKKPISRTDSQKSLARTSSISGKPPLKKAGSKSSLHKSNSSLNEAGKDLKRTNSSEKVVQVDSSTDPEQIVKLDNETQVNNNTITNEKNELVLMTKKNIVSMTTAAITSQPLEIVTTVTNQLPTTLEKAREKGIFERHSSKDSLTGKDEKTDKPKKDKTIFSEDNIRLRPLQPPYNDPQLERVKQKIDDILKTPEISRENILTASAKSRENKLKSMVDKTKNVTTAFDVKDSKPKDEPKQDETKEEKEQKENKPPKEEVKPEITKIRTEATKIVDSIITPVEEPKIDPPKETKKDIEPIVMVVNEKKQEKPDKKDIKENSDAGIEKVNETLVKGEAEVEVQSSNVSTPVGHRMDGSDKSQSNGGFPQSTSTTPKPPARTKKEQKEKEKERNKSISLEAEPNDDHKKPNICSRLMDKCKNKCCPCCVKGKDGEKEREEKEVKQGVMSKFSCCKKKDKVEEDVQAEVERAAGKGATIEFEDETRRKRKLRDIICCCGRRRRVSDASVPPQNVADVTMSPRQDDAETGCCGRKKRAERRDSILSDRPPNSCCSRLCRWLAGACRRRAEPPASRRASMFSKNKSLSPTLPPEDTRKKLDPSLIEHTSLIRAAIPVLPIVLAYFCLVCNVVVPGLGSIFSGLFCLCFGIPRFGVHDGAKYRIGSFVINLLVGCGQLFTVLFCVVGWGWSIWWGVIMIKISRKYRRLRAEAKAAEAEEAAAAAPVTANNHTRA